MSAELLKHRGKHFSPRCYATLSYGSTQAKEGVEEPDHPGRFCFLFLNLGCFSSVRKVARGNARDFGKEKEKLSALKRHTTSKFILCVKWNELSKK